MRSPIPVNTIKRWFFNYVATFNSPDPDIQEHVGLKRCHSIRVCREIIAIAQAIGLDREDLATAEIAGLLHDIGRFEQYARFRTFVDSVSMDHGARGAEIIEERRMLTDLSASRREAVMESVAVHNRATLPPEMNGRHLMFARLLRDADKLDIFRIALDRYRNRDGHRRGRGVVRLPDTPGISDRVCRRILEHRLVDLGHVRNLNDFKLLQVGWVFDIHFQPALEAMHRRGYIDGIRQTLPPSGKLDAVFSVVSAYMTERLQNGRKQRIA